ncbi:MAG: 2'-5' RNA ligase family protein [candidate division KSB1 bacterium]|jgi:2'-5' RNA ligase|nr:2'-5' RNA ligase family protein [candidate division KSB1 bacterium]
MTHLSTEPLVLTLMLDDDTFATFDNLRREYFPPERNHIPAHLTLFHALPGREKERIIRTLDQTCSRTMAFPVHFSSVRFLGGGVAIDVDSDHLESLRNKLASEWKYWLTKQDSQRYRPHITIQNKVSPNSARLLFNTIQYKWEAMEGWGMGLLLWTYIGGPWKLEKSFFFKSKDIDVKGNATP